MLNALDKYKEERKFFSTYVDAQVDEDGRMRCEYRQWGTQSAPGRLSSSAVMWGSGTNLQNQPTLVRGLCLLLRQDMDLCILILAKPKRATSQSRGTSKVSRELPASAH